MDKKLYQNIWVYSISYKTPTAPKSLRIRLDKIIEFIIFLDGKIKHLILFDYGLFNKICEKTKYFISKKLVLQIVLTTILERSELIYIIIYLLKKYWLFML